MTASPLDWNNPVLDPNGPARNISTSYRELTSSSNPVQISIEIHLQGNPGCTPQGLLELAAQFLAEKARVEREAQEAREA